MMGFEIIDVAKNGPATMKSKTPSKENIEIFEYSEERQFYSELKEFAFFDD
jgi:hypothetical protein